jgi:hypothetical protein
MSTSLAAITDYPSHVSTRPSLSPLRRRNPPNVVEEVEDEDDLVLFDFRLPL